MLPALVLGTDREAEVDAADNFGRTACHIAAENEDSQASGMLLAMATTCRPLTRETVSICFV